MVLTFCDKIRSEILKKKHDFKYFQCQKVLELAYRVPDSWRFVADPDPITYFSTVTVWGQNPI